MSANNETGVLQPVAEVARLCRERGVLFHVDATQSVGKAAVDVDFALQNGENGGCDLLTLSAHKIGGPKGVGALYIRRGTRMKPLLRGGAQERGRRAGTENVPGIVGFGEAARVALQNVQSNATQLHALQTLLEAGLNELDETLIIGRNAPRAPHITSFLVRGARAESLALNLDLAGFAVGTGSACASGALEPSHVLAAMGYQSADAKAALRVSLGVSNTEAEVGEFVSALHTPGAALMARAFLGFSFLVAAVGALVCFYYATLDWHALQKADAQFRSLAASGAGMRELFVAESRQNVHRINVFADIVWALLGCIWATLCVVGISLGYSGR